MKVFSAPKKDSSNNGESTPTHNILSLHKSTQQKRRPHPAIGSLSQSTIIMATTSGNDGDNKLDKAFELLHQGKSLQSGGECWNAADCFVQARIILQDLAKEQPTSTDEQQQIAKLYEEKSLEYLHQSRQCLIEAMKLETEKDENKSNVVDMAYSSLTDQQAETRIRTFYSLFSKPVNIQDGSSKVNDENIIDQQWSIEERLLDLNKSLPSGFKTSEERMSEINRGLNKLGLSLYDQKQPFSRIIDEVPKDEDEQVDDIIAQAKDEVAFDQKFGPGDIKGPTKAEEDNDDSDNHDDSDESEDEEDDLLSDEALAIKKIRKKAVKAQVKLAELVALLDEARGALDKEDDDDDKKYLKNDDSEQGSLGDDGEGEGSVAYLSRGKKKLKSARKELQKALTEWQDSL